LIFRIIRKKFVFILALASTESQQISKEDIEALLEELIQLHPNSPTFRQIFKSTQTTEMFLDAYKSFTTGVKSLTEIGQSTIALMDKVSHFALALALDSSVATAQQQEVSFSLIFFA
jgi:hypothetical protein